MKITFEFAVGDRLITLDELRRRTETAYLKHVVVCFGRRADAAAVLGISRKSLWERLKALGLSALSASDSSLVTEPVSLVAKPVSIAA